VTVYQAPIVRRETAKGHYYKDATGQRVTGVTTWIDGGIPKPALINWAGNATAEYAVDHWDDLADLPPAQRLKKLQGARYEVKDAAARRGTEVHKYAEELIHGKAVQVPDELAGYVDSYVRFLDEFDVQPVLVEFSCVSYRLGYAGTADLVADVRLPDYDEPQRLLMDVKTTRSGIFGETALQLAAYRYADKWIVDGEETDPLDVTFTAAIHVRADGYDLRPVATDREQHKAFWHAQQVTHHWERDDDRAWKARELAAHPEAADRFDAAIDLVHRLVLAGVAS
jgi:hypothetical protein